MAGSITVGFEMRVNFSKRLSRRDREIIGRLTEACRYLTDNRGSNADQSNLADVAEAMEMLASTVRRAKASAHNSK